MFYPNGKYIKVKSNFIYNFTLNYNFAMKSVRNLYTTTLDMYLSTFWQFQFQE